MRYRERFSCPLTFAALSPSIGTFGSAAEAYSAIHTTVSGSVYPLSSQLDIRAWGARVSETRAVFLPRDAAVAKGDGVWLPGENDILPPWRVVSVSAWPHIIRAILEKR